MILTGFLVVFFTAASLFAGRLDVAVVQFPEEKKPDELHSALEKVTLFEMTNADRTRTEQPYLKGGTVLFAQRFPVSPGAAFQTTTRLKNARADVEGRLEAGQVSVSVSLSEGIRAGLRSFQKKVYEGSGPLPPGPPRLLSVRRASGRHPSITKGQTKMESYQLTTIVVAQYSE